MDAKAAALQDEQKRAHHGRAVLAWNIANLARAKRMPKFETLLPRERKPPQTWQQQYDLMRQWHVAQERRKAAAAAMGT